MPDPLLGRVLSGRWTLLRALGAGGTASVYEAAHRDGRRVAIKVLHAELANQRVARKRFQSEGYAANLVGHPHAVAILDDGVEADGTVFLVMELLEGHSLAKPLSEGRALPVPAVASIALAVLDVLAAAHDHGVVHRDVKPANIFLTQDGQIKLLDFGVAHVAERLGVSIITQAGSAVGTPAFMAPEQAAGRAYEVDALTDIWAVGATMFQLLAQRLVHDVSSTKGGVLIAATRPAPLLRTVAPNVPAAIAQVVDRALAFRRPERWPNARAMRQALLDACPELRPRFAQSLGTETVPEVSRRVRPNQAPLASHHSSGTRERNGRRPIRLVGLTFALMVGLALGLFYTVQALRRAPFPTASAEPSAAPRASSGIAVVPAQAQTLPALDARSVGAVALPPSLGLVAPPRRSEHATVGPVAPPSASLPSPLPAPDEGVLLDQRK